MVQIDGTDFIITLNEIEPHAPKYINYAAAILKAISRYLSV